MFFLPQRFYHDDRTFQLMICKRHTSSQRWRIFKKLDVKSFSRPNQEMHRQKQEVYRWDLKVWSQEREVRSSQTEAKIQLSAVMD